MIAQTKSSPTQEKSAKT